MRVENGPYAGWTSGKVVDTYRDRTALIAAQIDELALVGFREKLSFLHDRIQNMKNGNEALRNSIPESEFRKANRPHRRLCRYLGAYARMALRNRQH